MVGEVFVAKPKLQKILGHNFSVHLKLIAEATESVTAKIIFIIVPGFRFTLL